MKKGLVTPNAFQKWQGGHPWFYANEILYKKNLPQRPSAVFFGDNWWFCSPKSYLRLRRFGQAQSQWMKSSRIETITNAEQFRSYFGEWLAQFFAETLVKKMRAVLKPGDDVILRWIFSDADLIPGLTVDAFKDTLVCQITTAPVELFWFAIRDILAEVFTAQFGHKPKIVELRNSPVRKNEGLEVIAPATHSALTSARSALNWNGYKWYFQLDSPTQKTGAYLDQRDNHVRVAELAECFGLKTAWDVCCYQGGFTVHLLGKGLTVTAVDRSQEALAVLKANINVNNLSKNHVEIVNADAFEWLREQQGSGRMTDLIVLDPPSFVKSRESLPAARKGYLELNRLAFDCLTTNGILVSCVCSHHMRPDAYHKILEAAAAPNRIEILERHGPSADHPVLAGFTESDYLHVWFIRRVNG